APTSTNPDAELVTVMVSPFEWKTLPFRGGQSLVAVRTVQMPGRAFAQGFVIDRTTLTSWLADRAGDSVAELRTDSSAARADVSSGSGARTDSSGAPTDVSGARTDASGARTDSSGVRAGTSSGSSGARTDASGARTNSSGARTDSSDGRTDV